MRKLIMLLIPFLALTASAQNGFNYQAVVKDGSGNIIANATVDLQFIIYQGVALTNNVYQETHISVTTSAEGLVVVTIGQGTSTDDFDAIDWGADEHFLNIQIDTGSGLSDLGTIPFKSVPYAQNAFNVNGLETLNEGSGNGWRLVGKDPVNYGNIGLNAVDLSHSSAISSTRGATGANATTLGFDTTASGDRSTAMGSSTTASGFRSTAMGNGSVASNVQATALGSMTVASGFSATAMGGFTEASGTYTTAMGQETQAQSNSSTAIGRYNVGGGDPSNWVETDPLFEIGNGNSDAGRSNAVTVLKNGNVGIGTTVPDGSAILEMKSTNKGVLVPRLSSLEIENLVSPAHALLVYQLDGDSGFYYNAGTSGDPAWTKIGKNEPETTGSFQFEYIPITKTFTVPVQVSRIYFEIVAGGGGAGGTYLGPNDANKGGGGGGGGGYASGYINVTPGEVLTLVVGARGTNGTNGVPGTQGISGSPSSISSGGTTLIGVSGGIGGSNGTSTSGGTGGNGGSINALAFSRVKLTCPNWASVAGAQGLQTFDFPDSIPIQGTGGTVHNQGNFNRLHRYSTTLFAGASPSFISLTLREVPFYGIGAGRNESAQGGYIVLNW